jgi:hypothetical protein
VILIRDDVFVALKNLLEGPPAPIAFVLEDHWCIGIECADKTMLMVGKNGTTEWRGVPVCSDWTSRALEETDINYAYFTAAQESA